MRQRVALSLFWGRWGLPIPRKVPLRVVIGAPITLHGAKADVDGGGVHNVTDEEVQEAHAAYVTALKRLFDDSKARFGYADRELVVL